MKVTIMKFYIFSLLLLICFSSVGIANAQVSSIKVSFEKDGKQIDKGFRVRIYSDEQSYYKDRGHNKGIKPKVKQSAFIVPPEIMKQEKVIIIFEISEFDLAFFDVPTIGFNASNWTVGVDTKPFEKENIMGTIPEKNIDIAAYLEFLSKEGKKIKILVNRHK